VGQGQVMKLLVGILSLGQVVLHDEHGIHETGMDPAATSKTCRERNFLPEKCPAGYFFGSTTSGVPTLTRPSGRGL